VTGPDISALADDVAAEHAELAAVLGPLSEREWSLVTPSPGWTIRDQITHLAWFDRATVTALTDPEAFSVLRDRALEAGPDFVDEMVRQEVGRTGASAAAWWAEERARLVAALGQVDPSVRVPWFGPAMSVASKATARIMETWAHGQDVLDALGRGRAPTTRLRHVAHIGVRARPNSYAAQGRQMPAAEVVVSLVGPAGECWSWGDPGLPDRVDGSALDFCLVVTRRRHVDDTDLKATPGPAREWMEIAQAFAGEPGPGRTAGQFPRGAEGRR
jgi:uncharacterized protein (TIGR03084 family)